ncbi:MAG TPA: hypothetical protein VNB23_13310, partial [Ramlibacter sp.]|nr:hypothetical protein [Ramlibacter sp.]
INKRAASALARRRQDGDVWLAITDRRPGTFSVKLDPTGGDLAGRGLRLRVNGRELRSASENGFVARLGTAGEAFRITLQDAPCPVWLKVVAVRLPFTQSRLLHAGALPPGTHELSVDGALSAIEESDQASACSTSSSPGP